MLVWYEQPSLDQYSLVCDTGSNNRFRGPVPVFYFMILLLRTTLSDSTIQNRSIKENQKTWKRMV